MRPTPPYPLVYEPLLRLALAEDLGRAGDLTTEATVAPETQASAKVVARRGGSISGLPMAAGVFALLDPAVRFEPQVEDGDVVAAASTLARISGPARAILTGERTALNLLGHLSGVATATRALVHAVAGTHAAIVCTRKTTPGLRALEKYAVRCGGGANHRFGLDDAVLIKDNHLVAAGGVRAAIERARAAAGHLVKIECEVQTTAQLEEALAARADVILLDNMTPPELADAVRRIRGRAIAEASGGITLDTVRAVAESGVDLISVGWITHSAPTLDVALDFDE
ncbi:MAG: carboxylating nicotinate-nucleotide diphosphorylase [Thermoanaerobaculia bacterium]|nr:carboxylating nicotinate-nucleotide diphosphorylase [Thermoanaerobaculia bacterium]